jgi:uncharacterized protein YndB with AHSA1/START domain
MRLQKTVVVDKPLDTVFAYLADFRTTTEWDPGTVITERLDGDGGVGTTYLNVSTFLGRQTRLEYVVQQFVPGERVLLRAENRTVVSVDTMTFSRSVHGSGTEVTYNAQLTFKGAARLAVPFLRPAFARLGRAAQTGMREALTRL